MNLITRFGQAFQGQIYRHRSSTVGDRLGLYVFEDLHELNRSPKLVGRIASGEIVANMTNRVTGKPSRRGDGTLGERLVSVEAIEESGFNVYRGPTANIHVGVEVKILATAMIKQIDRVIGDLQKQAAHFRSVTPDAISLGIVGVNMAATYRSYEGNRTYDKPGSTGLAPASEAAEAIRRLRDGSSGALGAYDELLILEFVAPNQEPFPFAWANATHTANAYAAVLQRLSRLYEQRF